MSGFWETAFVEKQTMWGDEPTVGARLACDFFVERGAREILVPGVGYGRNARPFLERGMGVTGIEISETAIELARTVMGLDLTIHHGPVGGMPFDDRLYDGVFCHALVHLLDASGRQKLIADCHRQLAPGGHMIFTLLSKDAPMYGTGAQLGPDTFEVFEGVSMFFYDRESVQREFGGAGLSSVRELDEPSRGGASLPFLYVVCAKAAAPARDD